MPKLPELARAPVKCERGPSRAKPHTQGTSSIREGQGPPPKNLPGKETGWAILRQSAWVLEGCSLPVLPICTGTFRAGHLTEPPRGHPQHGGLVEALGSALMGSCRSGGRYLPADPQGATDPAVYPRSAAYELGGCGWGWGMVLRGSLPSLGGLLPL